MKLPCHALYVWEAEVTSHVEVWIETVLSVTVLMSTVVTSHVEVWIETSWLQYL